jgi:hypothetical protein
VNLASGADSGSVYLFDHIAGPHVRCELKGTGNSMVTMGYRILVGLGAAVGLLMLSRAGGADSADIPGAVYPTYGVHNDANTDRCAQFNCLYRRTSGEPTDPIYPPYCPRIG